jgi:hypothetical protein
MGHLHYSSSVGGIFHIIESNSNIDGSFVGRTQILTRSYISYTPTKVWLSQDVEAKDIYARLGDLNPKAVSLSIYSLLESTHYRPGFKWGIRLIIFFTNGQKMSEDFEFNPSSTDWQHGTVTVCLSTWANIEKARAVALFEGYRGVALWDAFTLTVNNDMLE